MRGELIDVWDIGTFDAELAAELEKAGPLIQSYLETEESIRLAHDLASGPNRPLRRPRNPDAAEFSALETETGMLMRRRAIRAWHYTRLTDAEVDGLTRDGVHLSTLESLRARLDALVAAGDLSPEQADELYRASRLHNERKIREKKFWMTSHPEPVDDPGVRELLGRWGGEVAYAGLESGTLLNHLQTIGKPRVLEIAVPLAHTSCAIWAGRAGCCCVWARARMQVGGS